MDRSPDPDTSESASPIPFRPTGGVPLSEERLRILLPQWEAASRSVRRMDGLPLGDTEPATVFVWGEQGP